MTFNSRYYAYGITEDGAKEFLHTFLCIPTTISYLQSHRKLFGNRYKDYFYKNMSNNVEIYLQ